MIQTSKWKALYQGHWFPVKKIDDTKTPEGNVYWLDGLPEPIPADEIQDLDPGIAASFREIVASRYRLS